MIAIAKKTKTNETTKFTDEEVHAKYHELEPSIIQITKIAFRGANPDKREDAVQSSRVHAFNFLKGLAKQGRLDEANASTIAYYAIKSYKCGRIGGIPSSATDVLGERCRILRRATVENFGLAEGAFTYFMSEATRIDGRVSIPRTVALRVDFVEWYQQQSSRDQEIIKDLAYGEGTSDIAKKYGVRPGAVSQWRRKYEKLWYAFINPPVEETTEKAA